MTQRWTRRPATRRRLRERRRAASHAAPAARRRGRRREKVFHVEDLAVAYYGSSRSRTSRSTSTRTGDRVHRAVGLRQEHLHPLLQPDERPDPRRGVEGTILYHGKDLYARESRPGRGAPADRDGLPEAEPVPEVDLRQRRVRAPRARAEGRPRRAGRARAAARRALGRGQGPAQGHARSASRAASSSGSASRGRSRSSPT